jgi:hypothetical protein
VPIDRNGQPVHVGTRVRIVKLSESLLGSLPEDEVAEVLSMIGEVFEVTEIDEHGSPWVGKDWRTLKGGGHESHSIALSADEMEVVDEAI